MDFGPINAILKTMIPEDQILSRIKREIRYINEDVNCIQRGSESRPFGKGTPYAGLSIQLRSMSYLKIALGEYSEAIGSLLPMCRTRNWLYEKHKLGWDISPEILSAGNWQCLLLSLLTNQDQFIRDFCDNFMPVVFSKDRIFQHTNDSLRR